MVFAWDGFWQAKPSDQQQRLATYALRMLGSAAVSFASLHAHGGGSELQPCCKPAGATAAAVGMAPATPQFMQACLVSACLQLVATRPQYLPAVEAFLANCGTSCMSLQQMLLNAIDALCSATAVGTFTSLKAQPATTRQRSAGSRHLLDRVASATAAGSSSSGSPRGSPPTRAGLGGVLQRMRTASKRFASSLAPPSLSPGVCTERFSASCCIQFVQLLRNQPVPIAA